MERPPVGESPSLRHRAAGVRGDALPRPVARGRGEDRGRGRTGVRRLVDLARLPRVHHLRPARRPDDDRRGPAGAGDRSFRAVPRGEGVDRGRRRGVLARSRHPHARGRGLQLSLAPRLDGRHRADVPASPEPRPAGQPRDVRGRLRRRLPRGAPGSDPAARHHMEPDVPGEGGRDRPGVRSHRPALPPQPFRRGVEPGADRGEDPARGLGGRSNSGSRAGLPLRSAPSCSTSSGVGSNDVRSISIPTRSSRIADEATHSAFTDLLEVGGRLHAAFREGDAHVHAPTGGYASFAARPTARGACWPCWRSRTSISAIRSCR